VSVLANLTACPNLQGRTNRISYFKLTPLVSLLFTNPQFQNIGSLAFSLFCSKILRTEIEQVNNMDSALSVNVINRNV
jgi:hypothetical protein